MFLYDSIRRIYCNDLQRKRLMRGYKANNLLGKGEYEERLKVNTENLFA